MTPTTPTQGEMRLVPVDTLKRVAAVLADPKAEHPHDVSYLVEEVEALSAAPFPPVVGREEIARAVRDWIRDDAPLGLKLQMDRVLSNTLTDRILSALHASPDKMEKGHD